MTLVVFFHLGVGDDGIQQLLHYLALVGVDEKAVAVFVHLAAEVVLDVLLSLRQHDRLPHPLVDIVVNDSRAVLSAHSFSHKADQVVHVQFMLIDPCHQRRLFFGVLACRKGEQQDKQQANS